MKAIDPIQENTVPSNSRQTFSESQEIAENRKRSKFMPILNKFFWSDGRAFDSTTGSKEETIHEQSQKEGNYNCTYGGAKWRESNPK